MALQVLRTVSGALATAPLIKRLNLSDNALGEKGIRACEEVLRALVGGENRGGTLLSNELHAGVSLSM